MSGDLPGAAAAAALPPPDGDAASPRRSPAAQAGNSANDAAEVAREATEASNNQSALVSGTASDANGPAAGDPALAPATATAPAPAPAPAPALTAEADEASPTPSSPSAKQVPASNAALQELMSSSDRLAPAQPSSVPSSVPSSPPHHASFVPDEELSALKNQIAELTSQVTSLNGKLVQSYNRVGGLEDDIHGRAMEAKALQTKVEKLEAERKTWEERYEGGLLVEKDHVQQELSRMMDRVIEETAERGKAENDKATIERELAELSSSLFQEANQMVAIERMERLRAERKMEQLDQNLKDTEGMMTSQSEQMRNLGGKIDELEKERDEMRKRLEQFEQAAAEAEAEAAAREAQEQPAVGESGNASGISLPSESTQGTVKSPVGGQFPLSIESGISSLQPPLPAGSVVPTTPGSTTFRSRELPPTTISHPIQYLSFDIVPFYEFVVFTKSLMRMRKNITTRLVFDAPPNPYGYSSYGNAYGVNSASGVQSGSYTLSAAEQKEALNNALPLTQYADFPFLKRIMSEDSEPSLRLDSAPGLTFFSRRQVQNAIIDGNLAIEPAYVSLPSDQCALCGVSLQKFIASHQTTQPKEDQRKKLTRLATGWIPNAISGTSTPTKEQQEKNARSGGSDSWSISALSDALQGALTPAKELGGFNFSIGGGSSEKDKASAGHYTPYSGNAGSRPGSSAGTGGSGLERRPSNLSRSNTASSNAPSGLSMTERRTSSTLNVPSSESSPSPASNEKDKDKDPHQGTFMLNSSARQNAQVYLFRSVDSSTKYAVCPTYCLPRLRAVCELWTYIRTIEKGLLSEDSPKFHASSSGSTGEYAQQVRKLTNNLQPPASASALVKGLATPALGASKQVGDPPPASASGSAPPPPAGLATSKASVSESGAGTEGVKADTEPTGLGLDIKATDFAQRNASAESLSSATSNGNVSGGQAQAGSSEPARDPDGDQTPSAERPADGADGSRRASVDTNGNGNGSSVAEETSKNFSLTLPPARPKRSAARGTATPTASTTSSSPMVPSTSAEGAAATSETTMATATSSGQAPTEGSSAPAAAVTVSASTPAAEANKQLSTSPAQAPALPARTRSSFGAATSTTPQPGSMGPPRLPARPALPKLATNGPGGAEGGVVSVKQADWQQRCWYEIVRLKEVTFWTRVGSSHDR